MFNFSAFFVKQKKLLFFAFLSIFISIAFFGVDIKIARGIDQTVLERCTAECANESPLTRQVCIGKCQYRASAPRADLAESADDLGWGILNPGNLFVMMGKLAVNGSYKIAKLSSSGLDYVIERIMNSPITTDSKFTEAWAQIRNLGNMLIVLGFVVVGIATALRIQTYAATKLLWPLILIALLINFSGLFCGLIIDASNLVTNGLLSALTASSSTTDKISVSERLLQTLVKTSRALLNQNLVNESNSKFLAECWMFGAVYLGMAFTFLYLAVLLIARYVILIMLYILSPLAFAFWIFPLSKHLWTEWWKHFLKWAFVGVFGSFVLYLSTIILQQQSTLKNGAAAVTWDNIGSLFVQIIIVLGFLAVGFIMTSKSSGIASMATGAVMGLATGGAAMALGAVKLGGKGVGALARKADNAATGGKLGSAVGNMGRKISSSTGRLMDAMGGTHGATESSAMKKLEEGASLSSKMDMNSRVKGAAGKGMSIDAKKRAEITMGLVKDGKLGEMGGIQEQQNALAHTESYMKSRGIDTSSFRKDALKSNPNLGVGAEVGEATRKVAPAKAAEWHESVVTPEVYNNLSGNQLTAMGKFGSPELIGKINAYQHNPSLPLAGQTKEFQALAAHVNKTTVAGSPERAKIDTEYARKQKQIQADSNYA